MPSKRSMILSLFGFLGGLSLQIIAVLIAIALVLVVLVLAYLLRGWGRTKLAPLVDWQQTSSAAWAEWRVTSALAHMDSAAPAISDSERRRLVDTVKTWRVHAPWAVSWTLVKLAFLLVLLFNISRMINSFTCAMENRDAPSSSRPDCSAEATGPLHAVWNPKTQLIEQAWKEAKPVVTEPLNDFGHTVTVVAVAALLVFIGMIVCTLVVILGQLFASRPIRRTQAPEVSGDLGGPVRQVDCWRLVLAVLATCADVGRAHQKLKSDGDAPRVSLERVEHVVYSAWRTRRGKVRSSQRGEYTEHAAHVVGALRAMASRQDRDPDLGKVLEDTTVMLLKISDRYARARILALLDPEDLEGVEPVKRREWLRIMFVAVTVIGVVSAAIAWKWPEAAVVPLLSVVALLAGSIAYKGRVRGAELLSLLRGQGPSA
ncbi:hypothetical protein [Streptomyces sp. AC627_RSS907]|uniref:hypothetical protein n=1 Tax=Streptomyces sp. AC627_RSS907 TaxID=2823684 RepID=UPI001C237E0B|nr:hypothetical protein [Streptomyces sp. AC627_RSS907]